MTTLFKFFKKIKSVVILLRQVKFFYGTVNYHNVLVECSYKATTCLCLHVKYIAANPTTRFPLLAWHIISPTTHVTYIIIMKTLFSKKDWNCCRFFAASEILLWNGKLPQCTYWVYKATTCLCLHVQYIAANSTTRFPLLIDTSYLLLSMLPIIILL